MVDMNDLQDVTYEGDRGLAWITINRPERYNSFRDSSNIEKHGRDKFARFLAELQAWGTPDHVADELIEYQNIGAGGIIGVFSYGGTPYDEAEENMRLFSEKVMPRLQAHETEGGDGTRSHQRRLHDLREPSHVVTTTRRQRMEKQ